MHEECRSVFAAVNQCSLCVLVEVFDVVDRPVRFSKVTPCPRDIFSASGLSCARSASRARPGTCRPCPVTTRSNVENGKVVVEELVGIAPRRGPECKRSLPCPGHRVVSSDVCGDVSSREEPNADAAVDPLHGIDTTLIVIEGPPIAIIIFYISESAAGIVTVDDSTVGVEELAT